MSNRSNRSHCIVTIYIDSEVFGENVVRYGKLTIVDLAGSERANVSTIWIVYYTK